MIIFVVLLGIIASLFIAIQDPVFQKFAVRFASGYLSEKTGGDIRVGRLLITPDFRLFLDDISVKDLNDSDLAKIGSLRGKIDLVDLLEGVLHLESVELRDTKANLIKYEGEDKFNFAFLIDAFTTDTVEKPDKEPMCIKIDRITVKDLDFVYWNQNSDHPEKTENHLMDYSHLALESINLKIKDFYMLGDSIHAQINSLIAKEISGFELKNFTTDATVCQQGVFLDGTLIETSNSRIDADISMKFNSFDAISSFVDSVNLDVNIRPTDVMLSDLGVFTSKLYQMPDLIHFEGHFLGPIEHFRVDDFKARFGKITTIEGSLSMHPLDFDDGEHTLNIKKMRFSYDDLVNFYIPSSSKTIPLPESLRPIKEGRVSLNYRGSYNDFDARIHFLSAVGNADVNVSRKLTAKGDNVFSGDIVAESIQAGAIANAQKYIGNLDLDAAFVVKFPQNGNIDLSLNGRVYQAELLGNYIDEVVLNGEMKDDRFKGLVSVDDDDLVLDFNGLIDFKNKKYPVVDFEAVIDHADLSALKLMKNDSVSAISTRIAAKLKGFDLDDLEGSLHLDNTVFRDSRGSYIMNEFDASIVNDNLMQRSIIVDCDFFNFKMAGKMNFASLIPVFNEYGDSFVHFPQWESNREAFEKYRLDHDVDQDFLVSLNLKDTETISRLFMPSLKIAKNTSLNGTFTSHSRELNLTVRSRSVEIGKLSINNIELRNFNTRSASYGTLAIGEVEWANMSETDTMSIKLEDLSFFAKMANDTISTRIRWDDASENDRNKALIEGTFCPHETGGVINISHADITISDSLWNISPNNFIDFDNGRVTLSNLMFSHNKQLLRADGYVPMNEGDTLSVQLRSFDISNFDILLVPLGFNVDGFISGDALLSSLKDKPMVLADLYINKLGLNGSQIGDLDLQSEWDDDAKAIDLDVNAYNETKRMLNIFGFYYTARENDNLDFTIALDSLRLAILDPFLSGIVSRMQGYGNGMIDVKGSLQQPEINGKIRLDGGGCKIDYLNTFYTFSPTVLINDEAIVFENMELTDTLGNKALVEGRIRHNHLKDFYLDMKLHPRDFLAMATGSKDNDTFYGTAVANGLVTIKGPFSDLNLSIKAKTRKGTYLTVPLNRTSTVKENDFIVFINPEDEVEDNENEEILIEEEKKSNLAINIDVDATDDATMKILLPRNIGTIEASGNGNVKMATSSNEPFTMFGNYMITTGRFQLSLMNVVSRNFTMRKGGTISWSGSPTDGRINAVGVYSLKAPLSDLGVQIDTTVSSNSNVNVECLIYLKDALLNPTITFGMNLPNANEDILQTVYTLVDTTNQAVMTSQAISLLVLGKFAYAGGSAGFEQNFDLSHMFSSSMQFDITQNVNFGLSYHSGSIDSYDEYQLALRTQFFENRLTIETNLGLMSNNSPSENKASNIVGEFDLYYKLSKDGRLQGHFYNHSNYNTNFNSFAIDRRAPYTQGLGLSYSRSFRTFGDLFRKRTTPSNQPFIKRSKKEENN